MRHSTKHRSLAFGLTASLGIALAPAASHAQTSLVSRFAVRGEVGAGTMISSAQRNTLSYDSANVLARGGLAFSLVDFLAVQIHVSNGWFLRNNNLPTGGLVDLGGGLRLEPRIGNVGRFFVDANAGANATGDVWRFGFDGGLGFEFAPAPWIGVGPQARLWAVLADSNSPTEQTAFFWTAGLSLSLRVPQSEPAHVEPAPPADADRDGVPDSEDVCPNEPAGAHADPHRRGCPMRDQDRDGVLDDEDQCPTVPAGANPDPARRGCPAGDRDGDGVNDATDQCPDTPAGPHPDPERAGCPDGDQDHDGVLDHEDQCRTEPAGLQPDPARPGCPLPDRDHDGVPDAVDHCPDQPGAPNPDPQLNGCPGLVQLEGDVLRILQPVFFATNRDRILYRSTPVLTAVANALRATPAIRRIAVNGYTDEVGNNQNNMALSQRRAEAVVQWLTQHGVEASRMEAHGFGATHPLRDPAGLTRRALAAARRINRRVEFVITDPPSSSFTGGSASASEPAAPPATETPAASPAPPEASPAPQAGHHAGGHHHHH